MPTYFLVPMDHMLLFPLSHHRFLSLDDALTRVVYARFPEYTTEE
jgi:hypothetical protein